jgi:hypothetical protein
VELRRCTQPFGEEYRCVGICCDVEWELRSGKDVCCLLSDMVADGKLMDVRWRGGNGLGERVVVRVRDSKIGVLVMHLVLMTSR